MVISCPNTPSCDCCNSGSVELGGAVRIHRFPLTRECNDCVC
jgi:hypothetical protein